MQSPDPARGRSTPSEETLSAESLASAAGITSGRLMQLVHLGVIEPIAPGTSEFTAATAAKLRRMVRLRVDLGVGFVGAAIIVDLLQQLERLETELTRPRGDT
jgi:hypothetical protein